MRCKQLSSGTSVIEIDPIVEERWQEWRYTVLECTPNTVLECIPSMSWFVMNEQFYAALRQEQIVKIIQNELDWLLL